MFITIIETNANAFFSQSQSLEQDHPGGIWRYCRFINKDNVVGIFETEKNLQGGIDAHEDFFKYFLGLFSPTLNKGFELHQTDNFKDFCLKLNTLLNNKKNIYDLSVQEKWIWSEGDEIKIPGNLLNFLSFD